MRDRLTDPWTAPTTRAARPVRRVELTLVIAPMLGAVGAASRVLRHGFPGWAVAVVAIGVCLGLCVLLATRRVVAGAAAGVLLVATSWVWAAETVGRSALVVTLSGAAAALIASVGVTDVRSSVARPSHVSLVLLALVGGSWLAIGNVGLAVGGAIGVIAWTSIAERRGWSTVLNYRLVAGWRWLARSAAIAATAVLAMVLLYPVGLLSKVFDRALRGPGTTGWTVVGSLAGSPYRPYVRETRSVLAVRHGLAVVALGGAALWVLASTVDRPMSQPDGPELSNGAGTSAVTSPSDETSRSIFAPDRDLRFSELAAYSGVAFADELKEEQDRFANSLPLDPVTGHRSPDFAGRFTNVADGQRATVSPLECDCEAVEVWLLGGSSAFGLGQRDEHTIASVLVELAAADGVALEVRNFGVPGWTRSEETDALVQRLAVESPPDVVLFYDGFNDIIGGLAEFTLRGVRHGVTRFSTAELEEFGAAIADEAPLPDLAASARQLADRLHAQFVRATDALPESTDVVEFFQPDAFASSRQYGAIGVRYPLLSETEVETYLADLFDAVARQVAPRMVDLRHIYDEVADPVFSNLVHTNEAGAVLAAREIWVRLSEVV